MLLLDIARSLSIILIPPLPFVSPLLAISVKMDRFFSLGTELTFFSVFVSPRWLLTSSSPRFSGRFAWRMSSSMASRYSIEQMACKIDIVVFFLQSAKHPINFMNLKRLPCSDYCLVNAECWMLMGVILFRASEHLTKGLVTTKPRSRGKNLMYASGHVNKYLFQSGQPSFWDRFGRTIQWNSALFKWTKSWNVLQLGCNTTLRPRRFWPIAVLGPLIADGTGTVSHHFGPDGILQRALHLGFVWRLEQHFPPSAVVADGKKPLYRVSHSPIELFATWLLIFLK